MIKSLLTKSILPEKKVCLCPWCYILFFFFLIIIYAAKVSRVLHPLENAMSTLCTLEITDKTDYQRQVFGVYNDNKPRRVIYAIKIAPYTTQNKKQQTIF